MFMHKLWLCRLFLSKMGKHLGKQGEKYRLQKTFESLKKEQKIHKLEDSEPHKLDN